jgi:hypothetical protein
MTPTWMCRSVAVSLFAACVGLAALSGCGGGPTKPDPNAKKDEPKPGPNPNPGPGPNPTPPNVPPKNTLGAVAPDADKAQREFLSALVQGNAKHDVLSTAFAKVVGKPLLFPGDKEKGYSPDEATNWLKRAGDGISIGLPLKQQQAGEVVYIRGSITGPRLGKDASKTGGYSLRMVKEGGAWKVDWLSLTSVDITAAPVPPTPEAVAQEFAAVAFMETVADLNGMPRDDRAPLIAAAMTPELRGKWAPPFGQDTQQGYDYNPGKINTEATKIGGGTSALSASRVGDLPEFKVELTKPAGKVAYTVRLAKGAGQNQWLVSEVIEAK